MASFSEKDAGVPVRVDNVDDDLVKGPAVKEANVASVALTEAINAQKPSLWSKNMLQLYFIMGEPSGARRAMDA